MLKKKNETKGKITYTPAMKALEWTALLSLASLFFVPLLLYGQIPDIIPTHFDGAGNPNAWGGKGSIFVTPAIMTIVYLILFGVSRCPDMWNLPVKITEENKERMYKGVYTMLVIFRIELTVLFQVMNLYTIFDTRLPAAFLPITLAVVFGTAGILAVYSIKMNKTEKKEFP